MNKKLLFAFFILSIVFLTGCAGHNDLVGTYNDNGGIYGFWFGLWHGLTLVISLIGSFFNSAINIYEVHNTGFGYNIGFVLGILWWVLLI